MKERSGYETYSPAAKEKENKKTQNGLKTSKWRSWIRLSGSSDLSLTAVFVSTLCTTSMLHAGPSVMMMLVFAFSSSSPLSFVPPFSCLFLNSPFTVAVSDPFCSPQVCKPGSVLFPQIPQTILILICCFPPWLLKPMCFLYLMENLLNLMFMFLGRGQKLEKTPMGLTGWTCKVRIETWTGIEPRNLFWSYTVSNSPFTCAGLSFGFVSVIFNMSSAPIFLILVSLLHFLYMFKEDISTWAHIICLEVIGWAAVPVSHWSIPDIPCLHIAMI